MPANNNPFMDLDVSPSPAPTQSPSNENPFLTAPIVDQSAIPQQPRQVSPLTSAASGVNQVVEHLPANIASLAARGTDALGATDNAAQKVDQFYGNRADEYQQNIDQHPTAGLAGQMVGGVALAAPFFGVGGGLMAGALEGGGAGYFGTDPRASAAQKIVNSGLGALGGMAGNALGQGFNAYATVRGTNASQLAELATQNALQKMFPGQDFSKMTPGKAFQTAEQMRQSAKTNSNVLYGIRDAIANKEGATVNFSPLKDDLSFYANGNNFTKTRQGSGILDKVESDQPLSYPEAQSLVSLIGKNANTAQRTGNSVLHGELVNLKHNILNTIDLSGRSEKLNTAHQVANNYYRNVYTPLNDIGTRKILAEHYADSSYMRNALDRVMQNPEMMEGLNNAKAVGLGDAIPVFQAAHINADKAAASLDGTINPLTYAKNLKHTLDENPTPFNPIADHMRNLAEALQVTAQLKKMSAEQTAHSFGQKIAIGVLTGTVGGLDAGLGAAGAAYAAPKAAYFYTAGRLLKDPETAALLERSGNPNLSPGVRGAVQKAIREKYNSISDGFNRVASQYGVGKAAGAAAKSVPVAVTNTIDQYQPPT